MKPEWIIFICIAVCGVLVAIIGESNFYKKKVQPVGVKMIVGCFAVLAFASVIIFVIKGVLWVIFIIIRLVYRLFN